MKLFGKTIPISELDLNQDLSVKPSSVYDLDHYQVDTKLCKQQQQQQQQQQEQTISDKDQSKKEHIEDVQEVNNSQESTTNDSKEHTDSSVINENPKTPSANKGISKNKEQSDTSVSQDNSPKNPDKILPCPRCNSMETKFCYYNNYNVSQPRHFCKNCQRYWTAGGTMRNVPVGAGRRKSKSNSASQYGQFIVSQVNAASGFSGTDGFVLTFGSECQDMLNLSEKSKNFVPDAYRGIEKRPDGDDRSCGSSITASSSSQKYGILDKNYHGLSTHIPCIPRGSWPPNPWNSAQLNSTGFPIAIFPTPPYWGCTVPTAWNLQCLSPTSPHLGKHSREGKILSQPKFEKNKPLNDNNDVEYSESRRKTLRIDDHAETGKSSVWSKLGIRSESTRGGGLFDGILHSKGSDKIYADEKLLSLQANPAAMLRSAKFCEST